MGALGLEPRTHGLKGRCSDSTTQADTIICDDLSKALGHLLGHLRANDPEVAAEIEFWLSLPEPVRANLRAMIVAVKG